MKIFPFTSDPVYAVESREGIFAILNIGKSGNLQNVVTLGIVIS